MSRQFSLPQNMKIVQLTSPVTTNGGVTTDVISLKNAHKAWLVVELTQAQANATQLSLKQATDVAAGTNKAGPTVPIWANEDTVASDTLVKQADAASYTVANDAKHKQVVFEIDPSRLDIANGYDCVYLVSADSTQATDFISVTAYLQTRYEQATPPSAIID